MTYLVYGSYAHPITPVVVMTQRRQGQAGGADQCWLCSWDIRGELIADGDTAIQTLLDALVAAYAADGQDLTLLAGNGSTVLAKLDPSDGLRGVRVAVRPEFPEGRGAEYATYRTYHLVVEAEYTTAAAYSATAYGGYTTSAALDVQGQLHYVRTGQYTGAGRQAAADAAKLTSGYSTIVEEQTDDTDALTIRFRYEYVGATGREVVSWFEDVQIGQALVRRVARLLLDAGVPVIQETVLQPARVTQTGRAVGLAGYPTPPADLFASSAIVSRTQERHAPRRTADGNLTEYGISWAYEYLFAETPAWVSPNNPPA